MTDKLTEVAIAIARAHCDDYDTVPRNKAHWVDKRSIFNGEPRDINMPFQIDYDDMAKAAMEAHEAALKAEGLVIVPREATPEMLLDGARSIGLTMGAANHIERSRPCWKAMLAALEVK